MSASRVKEACLQYCISGIYACGHQELAAKSKMIRLQCSNVFAGLAGLANAAATKQLLKLGYLPGFAVSATTPVNRKNRTSCTAVHRLAYAMGPPLSCAIFTGLNVRTLFPGKHMHFCLCEPCSCMDGIALLCSILAPAIDSRRAYRHPVLSDSSATVFMEHTGRFQT